MTRARSLLDVIASLPLAVTLLPAGAVLAGSLLAPATAWAESDGAISGVVIDAKTKQKIKDALVILQCTCLQGTREARTNETGLYAFRDLPPGAYTVQILSGQANVSKIVTLPRGAKFRANFSVDPSDKFNRTIVVETKPIRADAAISTKVDMSKVKDMPVGGTGRDFTDVVTLSPTVTKDAAGFRFGGSTGAENNFRVDGANVNNPAFGTVGSSIVQEFISDVEITESGYDAELGFASGGQVRARRISGTNKVRGEMRVTYTPRLAAPRFIQATDEALRVTQVNDYAIQGVVVASGPIIKDKLFWSVGFAPEGAQGSMIQSFYHRVDRDMSGGFEECPYKNGDNDCVPGGNYIQTERFAQQTFKTRSVRAGWQAVIDWAINPRHRLRLSAGGGPSWNRRSFRLPYSGDPFAFGTNPLTSPLGGGSRVGSGIINNHFGSDLTNQTSVGLDYAGRVADDKLEIDANVSYSYFNTEQAWKLDNANFKQEPGRQDSDNQGASLFSFLVRDESKEQVPGVDEQCNARTLPGLACPVRLWRSGGIGPYGSDSAHSVDGAFALTHFFNAAGAHQLKYGAQINHSQRHTKEQYSGNNAADFYQDGCGSGLRDFGEFCWDPNGNAYVINNATRVDNHRFVLVDTDNPDQVITRGYGRIRREQDDLRAIANQLGAGVRAAGYDATLSSQNYGIYLQDKWAVLSNLYLNAGVRWEIQDMRDVLGNSQILIWDNVAPRVGLTYDWTDEGKSRLYASYGWFYQQLPLQLNSRAFGGLVQVGRTYRASDCTGIVAGGNADQRMSRNGLPTEWCPDFQSFTTGLTAGTKVPRLRGMYNEQFQLGYEQEVIEDLVLGVQWIHTNLGRAVEDISTNGGLNFLIANPGEAVAASDIQAKDAECARLHADYSQLMMGPDSPEKDAAARAANQCDFLASAYRRVQDFDKPTRNYDAWTFRIQKRFAKNWLLLANYTYSRLVGNYDGFIDRNTGAINVGASTQFDIPELIINSFGPLFQNVPHVVRLNGFYSFDLQEAGRLTLGTSFNFQSGFPVNLRADNNRYAGGYLVYVLPRGSAGQIEPNYIWNVSLSYAYPLPKELELEFAARVLNVTNAKAVLRVDEIYSYSFARAVPGGDLEDLKHTKVQSSANPTEFFQRGILAPQGNFGVETMFQTPIAGQFELRLRF